MPAKWEDNDALVVRLAHPQEEPSLHLTPEETGFYYDGPCLVAALSMDISPFAGEEPDLTWLEPLEPYRLVEADETGEAFQLVKIIRSLDT